MFLLQEEQQEDQQGSSLFHPDVSFRLKFRLLFDEILLTGS